MTSPDVERLSDSHYVDLILRLLLDKQGLIVHGEVGGVKEEELWVRFRGREVCLPRSMPGWRLTRPACEEDEVT
jgi:hypothetical protein